MEVLITAEDETEQEFAALLYHPQWPCANPGARFKMTKQQAIHMGSNSWLTD